jgi:undecaprenyl-diphosphatase
VTPGRAPARAAWPPVERTVAAFAILTLAALVLLLLTERHDGVNRTTDAMALVALRHATDHPGGPWTALRETMLTATALGAFPTLAIVLAGAVGLLASLGRGAAAARFAGAALAGMACANLLKHAVSRPRPEVVAHWADVTSSSFPSGHSADGAVTYLLLACLAAGFVETPAARRFVAAFALLLVLLIGASRLYLGVHWPTDVLGGWCFGGAWTVIAAPFVRTGSWRASASIRHSEPSPRSGHDESHRP